MNEYGVLLINKPKGLTSFDVVKKIRKLTNIRKVGHTGTLDPFAEGLLIVCIGKATKIIKYLINRNKTYEAKLKLGIKTDTADITGKIIAHDNNYNINKAEITDMIKYIKTLKKQVPPKYSAIKIKGKKAYELARENKKINLKPRDIKILKFFVKKVELPYIDYQVQVSKGTYIRTLSEQIANKLGTIATTVNLIRTNIGELDIKSAVKLEQLNVNNWKNYLSNISEILIDWKVLILTSKQLEEFKYGRSFSVKSNSGKVILIDKNDNEVGLGLIKQGILYPERVFI